MLDMLNGVIKGLSEEQYHNLLTGKATLQYVPSSGPEFALVREKIIKEAHTMEEIETTMGKPVKKYLIAFCRHEGIGILSKDTKAVIYQKIASHFKIDGKKVENEETPVIQIANALKEINIQEDAKEFLLNHPLLRTKKDLMYLAKVLHVHINKSATKMEILNRVVASVTGAKARGKLIRGEN